MTGAETAVSRGWAVLGVAIGRALEAMAYWCDQGEWPLSVAEKAGIDSIPGWR